MKSTDFSRMFSFIWSVTRTAFQITKIRYLDIYFFTTRQLANACIVSFEILRNYASSTKFASTSGKCIYNYVRHNPRHIRQTMIVKWKTHCIKYMSSHCPNAIINAAKIAIIIGILWLSYERYQWLWLLAL